MKPYYPTITFLFFAALSVFSGCRSDRDEAETEIFIDLRPQFEALSSYDTEVSFSIEENEISIPAASIGAVATEDNALAYDAEILSDFCLAVSALYSREPVDASIEHSDDFENPFVLSMAEAGLSIDSEELQRHIAGNAGAGVSFEAETISPDIDTEALQEQNSLLSSYTTSFDSSTLSRENRVFNIKKAAELIDGTIVEPGEVFSANETIGDRNRKNGWKEAGAISGGTYVQEYGGGVCQVSSTLFNAVMMADLEIVERHHHSWPMSYVPIGRDATISTGIKDFRFKNTSPAPITIRAKVDEDAKTVIVCIYGQKSDAYSYIEIESEKTGNIDSLPDEIHLDESLPSGSRIVEREGRRGRKSTTYKLYYAEDGTLIEKVVAHKDTYPSIAAIIYLSPDLYY
ncbi:MAG: VanW family protein [Clostridia bacterium]|nr:VanW family protein [Clostridia bacterium]